MTEPQRPDLPEHDPALDAAWKAHSTELPPPRVDAAILSAAHREVHARPRDADDDDVHAEAREPARVWWGLAAAATIGAIAFGVVQMAPPPVTETPSVASDVPAAATPATPSAVAEPKAAPETRIAATTASPPSAPAAKDTRGTRPEPQPVRAKRERSAERDAPASAPPPPPAKLDDRMRANQDARSDPVPMREAVPAAAPPAPQPFPGDLRDKAGVANALRAPAAVEGERATAPPRQAPASPPVMAQEAQAPAAKASASGALRRDEATIELRKQRTADSPHDRLAPGAWVAKIVALMNAGQRDEAARELRAFRNAYGDADTRLPESLRAWAATVKRD